MIFRKKNGVNSKLLIMKKCFLLIVSLLSLSLYSQKTKLTKKPIDEIYNEYKSRDTVLLTTADSKLIGKVVTKLNSEGKPISVKIGGSTSDDQAVLQFILNTISMKSKQGYLPNGDSNNQIYNSRSALIKYAQRRDVFKSFEENALESQPFNLTMIKGKTCFRVYVGYSHPYKCGWSIELYDIERDAGKDSKSFKF
jgi:hypothetical protein